MGAFKMTQHNANWTAVGVESMMGKLLLAGVITAATVVLIGGGLYVAQHGSERSALRTFQGEPLNLRSPREIVGQAFAWKSRGLIQLGLLLLIATPVFRVAFSIYAFARQRDYVFVVITLVVLAILLYSLSHGFADQ
jgi:uncharacterized membrane protein